MLQEMPGQIIGCIAINTIEADNTATSVKVKWNTFGTGKNIKNEIVGRNTNSNPVIVKVTNADFNTGDMSVYDKKDYCAW